MKQCKISKKYVIQVRQGVTNNLCYRRLTLEDFLGYSAILGELISTNNEVQDANRPLMIKAKLKILGLKKKNPIGKSLFFPLLGKKVSLYCFST